MAAPPKFPRPQKPPVLPPDPKQEVEPTVSPQYERLIGRTIAAWSKLEACMEDFIWSLLKVEIEQGRVMTARVDAVGKIRMLRELGHLELPEAMFHRLSLTLDEIDVLRDDRNFIAHGSWGRTKVDMTMVHVCVSLRPKAPSPDQVVSETFPEKRMLTIIDGIERTKWTLIELMRELHTLPGRSVPPRHEGL
jgi:hypothetical protein